MIAPVGIGASASKRALMAVMKLAYAVVATGRERNIGLDLNPRSQFEHTVSR